MPEENLKRYFEILELNPDVSWKEIENAYLRLKKLYSTDSMVIFPIFEELSKKRKKEILKQIEEAYTKLRSLSKSEENKKTVHKESPASDRTCEGEVAADTSFTGPVLRQIRKKLGIQLYEIALHTKIRAELLENIELEKFDALPQEVYLRGHLKNYASYLSLNPKKVSDDYMRGYKEWKRSIDKED